MYIPKFMKARIQKWGNSLGIRIPIGISRDLSLKNGSVVDITEESNQIVIKPKRSPSLDELLDQITETNIHSETDYGVPEGNEVW
jgi:antitoxin MazE